MSGDLTQIWGKCPIYDITLLCGGSVRGLGPRGPAPAPLPGSSAAAPPAASGRCVAGFVGVPAGGVGRGIGRGFGRGFGRGIGRGIGRRLRPRLRPRARPGPRPRCRLPVGVVRRPRPRSRPPAAAARPHPPRPRQSGGSSSIASSAASASGGSSSIASSAVSACGGSSAASAAAARSRGSASTAPMPPPSRTPWSSSGSSEIRSSAFAWPGLAAGRVRPPTSPAPGTPPAAPTSPHAAPTTPSSTTGSLRTAGLQQEPGHRREVRAADRPEQRQLVTEYGPGPPQPVPDRGALAHPPEVVHTEQVEPGHDRRIRAAQHADQHARDRGHRLARQPQQHQVGAGVGLLVEQRMPVRNACSASSAVSASSTSSRPDQAHPVRGDVLGQFVRVADQAPCR